MNLSLRHLRLLALAGAFLLGLSSPVQAGDSEHGTCTIDMQHDTVTCTHNGTRWTCRDKGDQTWSCVSSFAAWTTDCPSCTGSSRSDYIYRF